MNIISLNLNHKEDRNKLSAFLAENELLLDKDVDYAIGIFIENSLVGCGCMAGNVLKCIAVDPTQQGLALTNRIVTYLRIKAYHENMEKLFLFTKPENRAIFESLGFYTIAESDCAILMENSSEGIEKWMDSLEKPTVSSESASLVMNCNPFTLGHRYLIEKACSENETVHLFVVKEDLSVFPFDLRMKLVREGTSDLKNLYIHEGRDYIISRATFPGYFIKDQKVLDESHARLDLDLFARRIAPGLSVTSRYVGEEPFCPVTSQYNSLMKEILPQNGINVVEIPRSEASDGAVSATKVRQALADGRLEDLKDWVPLTTYDFLASPEGRKIGDIIKHKAGIGVEG